MVSPDESDWSCRFSCSAVWKGLGASSLNTTERLGDIVWNHQNLPPAAGHLPQNLRISKSAPCSPVKPLLKKTPVRTESFHVVHKVPVGDTPYVKAKHVQLVDKDPDRAIALFWAAINAGDRVDSALKDMAIVMKQQNRAEEAIEAVKSLRSRCSDQAQESLDNVLLDLYKRCGRLDDQVALLKHKLHLIQQGMAFNGKRTKTARSQGKKFQVSIEQEATRLLGNLGWAYMQLSNFVAAEAVYRKALAIEPDNNKVCNLGICLMKQGRLDEAKVLLQSVTPALGENRWGSDSHLKSYERAQDMLLELENPSSLLSEAVATLNVEDLLSQEQFPVCQPKRTFPGQPRRGESSFSATSIMHQVERQPQHVVDCTLREAIYSTSAFAPLERRNTEDVYPMKRVVGIQEDRPCPSMSMFSQEWDAKSITSRLQDKKLLAQKQRSANAHHEQHALSFSDDEDGRMGTTRCALSGDVDPFLSAVRVVRYGDAGDTHQMDETEPFSGNGRSRMPLTFDRTNQHSSSADESSFAREDPQGKLASKTLRYGDFSVYPTQSSWCQGHYDENRPATRRSLSLDPFDLMVDAPAATTRPLLYQDHGGSPLKGTIPLLERPQAGNLLQWTDLGLGQLQKPSCSSGNFAAAISASTFQSRSHIMP